jgi:hypothetical protein
MLLKENKVRGTVEMTAAMMISGTIGWFVVISGQPVMDVVFWRCVFGAITLLIVCAARGLLRGGHHPSAGWHCGTWGRGHCAELAAAVHGILACVDFDRHSGL